MVIELRSADSWHRFGLLQGSILGGRLANTPKSEVKIKTAKVNCLLTNNLTLALVWGGKIAYPATTNDQNVTSEKRSIILSKLDQLILAPKTRLYKDKHTSIY